ncbi:MAG TPA: DUF1573 domain-containing protein [Pirellulales bacterium]|nr:DUF1573 domain-containing protein [Pirellulales bacterium]
MLRTIVLALTFGLLVVLASAPSASAQDWATKMFNTTSHDFGPVARGSKAQFRFQIKNVYEEDAHIVSVRSSCGCTVPQVTKNDLKTFETSEIIADFNTRDFLGQKTATLTVVFDKPFRADVQLHISGVIRSDVVLQPGAIDLGTIDVGTTVEKKLQVTYAGREDWKILDVKTADPHFEVEISELARGGGKVAYELLIRLTDDAPVGYIKDQLLLVTNDARDRELPVDMQARIVSDITIHPSQLFLGIVHPGQKITKKLVIRGKKPFKILEVQCADKSFLFEMPKEAKSVHLIPVVFTAGADPGRIDQKISILTDQGSMAQVCTAIGEVVPDSPGNSTASRKADPPAEQ